MTSVIIEDDRSLGFISILFTRMERIRLLEEHTEAILNCNEASRNFHDTQEVFNARLISKNFQRTESVARAKGVIIDLKIKIFILEHF